jgi:hypothetical protein
LVTFSPVIWLSKIEFTAPQYLQFSEVPQPPDSILLLTQFKASPGLKDSISCASTKPNISINILLAYIICLCSLRITATIAKAFNIEIIVGLFSTYLFCSSINSFSNLLAGACLVS